MISGSSGRRSDLTLIAEFGSLPDANDAARFLADRGVPAETIRLSAPGAEHRSSRVDEGGLVLPLIYAVVGGVLTGLAGSLVWTALAPDVLSIAWRVVASALVGASAGGSIGVAVRTGLTPPVRSNPGENEAGASSGKDGAVVAVGRSQVDHAVALLRRIGVDRMLVREDRH